MRDAIDTFIDRWQKSAAAAPDRAARRQALAALLLVVPAPGLANWLGLGPLRGTLAAAGVFLLLKVWMVGLPAIWLRRVERRPFSLSPMRHGGWRIGLASGVAIALAIVAAYRWLGPLLIDESAMRTSLCQAGLGRRSVFVVGAIYWITANSLLEEYLWRWFVVVQSERLVGGRWAAVVAALGFTLHHLVAVRFYMGWGATGLVCTGVFLGGLIWSACYVRYRSIWPGYLSHALADLAVFAIGWRIVFPSP